MAQWHQNSGLWDSQPVDFGAQRLWSYSFSLRLGESAFQAGEGPVPRHGADQSQQGCWLARVAARLERSPVISFVSSAQSPPTLDSEAIEPRAELSLSAALALLFF